MRDMLANIKTTELLRDEKEAGRHKNCKTVISPSLLFGIVSFPEMRGLLIEKAQGFHILVG